jgi:excisionase family DNA binding protein
MDLSGEQVAQRLRVDESRVRRLLREGRLAGHRFGGSWVVDGDDVVRLESLSPRGGEPRPVGRPMSAQRAWGLLELLDRGRAPWLSPVARSQVRAQARALAGADASRWCAALHARSDLRRVAVHPAAMSRLEEEPGVLVAGPGEAAAQGLDLVALGAQPELYVRRDVWPNLVVRYALDEHSGRPSLVVRLPRGGWWPADGELSVPVLAADLLENAEPRAVNAAARELNDRVSALLGASAKQRPVNR